jgi:hypothetical protein
MSAIAFIREQALPITLLGGGLTVIVFVVAYRGRWLRLMKDPAFERSGCTPAELERVLGDHLRELLITLVPFIVLFAVHLVLGHGLETLRSNELSLAAAVLCCQLIIRLQTLGWHRGLGSRTIEQTTASNRILYGTLLLVLTLVPALVNEMGDARAKATVEVPRVVSFLLAVYFFLRWGIGAAMSNLAAGNRTATD